MNDPTKGGAARYPRLFSPLALGPKTLKNRIIQPGHSLRLGEADGTVGARLKTYVEARAAGGAAMVCMESAPVHPNSHNYEHQLVLYDDRIVPGLAATADAVHRHDALLSIILWHGGHNVSYVDGQAAVAPSPIPSPSTGETPTVLTAKGIREIIQAHVDAAVRCWRAGLDAVELQTATDYLYGAFLSPRLNWREDAYGGSDENRVRIVAETLEAIRDATKGEIAVGLRTSATHAIPTDPDDYGLADSVAAMKLLADQGLTDWVSIINGSHWSFPELIAPMARPRAEHADLARDFTTALDVPVVVSGRIRTPAEAEHILASGAADIVGMARTLIADPDWPNKVAADDETRIRPCLSCNQGCLAFAVQHLAGTCIVNPAAGRESDLGDIKPATNKKTVAVIGGGPGGLEAARVAALRGHRVTLYEAEDHLGGAMRLAAESPHRGEMAAALDWWIGELAALGVTINTATSVDPENPPAADAVVWAIGAKPAITRVWQRRPHLRDGIPGTQGLPMGRDVMTGAAEASGSVLVIDEEGGWPTVSLLDHLAEDPAVGAITVVTAGADVCGVALDHTLERADVLRRFENTTLRFLPNALVAAVENGSIDLTDGARLGPYDAIILATGTASRAYPEDALAAGDCIAPRGIWAATNDAHRLARTL